MKGLLLVFFLCMSTIGFSQFKDELKDTLELRRFWADNIQHIIALNKEKILEQTKFPLSIQSKWIEKEQFEQELENHFTKEIRAELKAVAFKRVRTWYIGDDTTPTYMVACWETKDKEHSVFVVFSFFQYNGQWKLMSIDYI